MPRRPAVSMKTPTAKQVMTPKVLSVRDDLTLPELAAFLAENQITGAPVLDRKGHFVGVVSTTDLAEAEQGAGAWASEDRVASDERRGLHVETTGRQVRDIMTPTLYTVDERTPAAELARTMITGRVHRLLVTRKGRIVGSVTSLDLLKLLCEKQGKRSPAPGATTSLRTAS